MSNYLKCDRKLCPVRVLCCYSSINTAFWFRSRRSHPKWGAVVLGAAKETLIQLLHLHLSLT